MVIFHIWSKPQIAATQCRKKDGDWYIYPQFLAHENLNNVDKNVQKGYKIFKPRLHNVLSTGTNIVKKFGFLCATYQALLGLQGIKVKYTAAIFPYGFSCAKLAGKILIIITFISTKRLSTVICAG